jgi:hypothetical protein
VERFDFSWFNKREERVVHDSTSDMTIREELNKWREKW